MDLRDMWRGSLSMRRLGVLIRHLPRESALVTALNDGQPVWGPTEHLLADLWALMVRVNADPAKTPDNLDHPARQEMANKAKAAAKRKLKAEFLARKKKMSTA